MTALAASPIPYLTERQAALSLMPPPGDGGRFEALLAEWVLWQGDASPRTLTGRPQLVRRFAEHADPIHANWQDLARFLASKPDWSDATRKTYRAYLSAWFDWLQRMDVRPDNPVRKLRKGRPVSYVPRPISNSELLRLLEQVNRRRTRAMILLAAYQGFRASEIAAIRGEHFHDDTLSVLGKGRKLARLPVHPVIDTLRGHFPVTGWWFESYRHPGQPVSGHNVSRIVSEAMARAGVSGTCHQLRHWHATAALENSLDLRAVQQLMRHESPATTALYTSINEERRRAAINGLPLADAAEHIIATRQPKRQARP